MGEDSEPELLGDENGQWKGMGDEVSLRDDVGPGPWYGADDG